MTDEIYQFEANYLGCLLKDRSLIDEVSLTEQNFVSARNREWFKLIIEFHRNDNVLDYVTVNTIERKKLDSLGGLKYMKDLINSVASLHGFKTYENTLINHTNIQRAKDIAVDFIQNVGLFKGADELSKFLSNVTKLETSTVKKTESFKSKVSKRIQEHMESPVDGMSGVDTGFKILNQLTDGWKRKDLIVIAARPSMGKTQFGLATLMQGEKNDKSIMPTFISAEMSEGGIIDRLIAQIGEISLSKLRNINKYLLKKDDQDKYSAATGYLERSNFDLYELSTVPSIRAVMRKRIKEHPNKKHICCIDFLTQLRPIKPTGNANYDYGEIVLDLKQMAKDLDIPVILLAQLNRQNENRSDRIPTLSDIRDTGTVEQAGDIIAFIHREDYYNRDKPPTNIVDLIIAKNRQGKTGTVKFKTNLAYQKYYDMEGKG